VVPGEADITTNEKELTVLVRNAIFAFVRALARRDWALASSLVEAGEWSPDKLDQTFAPFFAEHAALRIDPKARAPENTRLLGKDDGIWQIEQILLDSEDANDWAITFAVDLAKSREAARPILALRRVSSG
jgi:hypothetical protein